MKITIIALISMTAGYLLSHFTSNTDCKDCADCEAYMKVEQCNEEKYKLQLTNTLEQLDSLINVNKALLDTNDSLKGELTKSYIDHAKDSINISDMSDNELLRHWARKTRQLSYR